MLKLRPDLLKKELSINMINMIGSLGTIIDLDDFYDKVQLTPVITGIKGRSGEKGEVPVTKKKKFYNSVTVYIKLNDRIVKAKVFTSGSVHMPGLSLLSESNQIMDILANAYPKDGAVHPQVLEDKTMFTTQYELNIDKFDGIKFCNILLSEYGIYATYDPRNFPGVIAKFELPGNDKNVVTGIFYRSGKICINGSNSKSKIIETYRLINDILMKNPEILIKYN